MNRHQLCRWPNAAASAAFPDQQRWSTDPTRITATTTACRRRSPQRAARNRRGAAAVLGLFLTTSLVVLMAVTLDYGYINVARSELSRSADAAAMAACWELYDQRTAGRSPEMVDAAIEAVATTAAALNQINHQSPRVSMSDGGIEMGHFDFSQPHQFDTSDPSKFNAVRICLRRQDASNGKVPLFFGALTGRDYQSLQTVSTAAMVKTVHGFRSPPSSDTTLDILPIALDLETWQQVLAGETEDVISYTGGEVQSGSDGYSECNLYPKGNGSPGNRGTVDIGGRNNSTADLSRQILHGISRQDFIDLGKPLVLDANGELELNGDTGISAGIKDELAAVIGQTRIIPIFSSVAGNGNNAMYTIVRFEGVRILDVRLTGAKNKKHLTIQPAPMIARHSIVDSPASTTSSYLYSPVMLVQ